MEDLTTILKDWASQLVNPLRAWFDQLDQKTVILAALFVLLVFVIRKPLAGATVRFSTFVGEKIGLKISKDVQDTIIPTIEVLFVSLSLLIGVDALQLPEIISGALEKIYYPQAAHVIAAVRFMCQG